MAVGAADASDLAASFFARSSCLKLLYSSSAFVLAWLRLHGNSRSAAAPAALGVKSSTGPSRTAGRCRGSYLDSISMLIKAKRAAVIFFCEEENKSETWTEVLGQGHVPVGGGWGSDGRKSDARRASE